MTVLSKPVSEMDPIAGFTTDMYAMIVDPNESNVDKKNKKYTIAQLLAYLLNLTITTVSGVADTLPASAAGTLVKITNNTNPNTTFFARASSNVGRVTIVKYVGSGVATLTRAGTDQFYGKSASNTLKLYPGQTYHIVNDGTFLQVIN